MGGKCSPSGGINDPAGGGKIDDGQRGKPNLRTDLYQDGELVQSRWYDSDGFVMWDGDYMH